MISIATDNVRYLNALKSWNHIGNKKYIVPWWEHNPARYICCILIYHGTASRDWVSHNATFFRLWLVLQLYFIDYLTDLFGEKKFRNLSIKHWSWHTVKKHSRRLRTLFILQLIMPPEENWVYKPMNSTPSFNHSRVLREKTGEEAVLLLVFRKQLLVNAKTFSLLEMHLYYPPTSDWSQAKENHKYLYLYAL